MLQYFARHAGQNICQKLETQTIKRFTRYELRTTDPDAARSFYSELLGHDSSIIWPLHENARARGAVAHWLGTVSLADSTELEQVCERFVARGAQRLGPTQSRPERGQFLVLRDPGGAIIGLNEGAIEASDLKVAWHVLNTKDLEAAIKNYQDLLGWNVDPRANTGPHGAFHAFSWSATSSESAGAMADIADRSTVHAHWLYFFEVDKLDEAVAFVRKAGGTSTEPITGPAGARVSVCEDAQRSAFGLIETQ